MHDIPQWHPSGYCLSYLATIETDPFYRGLLLISITNPSRKKKTPVLSPLSIAPA